MSIQDRSQRRYDITVWGATGFVGSLVAKYLAQSCPIDLNIAIAGRDSAELSKVHSELVPLRKKEIGIIIADSFDEQSLNTMVKETKVIIASVGPFAKYGTPLVDACVRFGTHYCDLAAEPIWIRSIIDKYHKKAHDNKVNIVHSCGFDSIPSDLGVFMVSQYVKQKYGADCGNTKTIVESLKGRISGGTIDSLLLMMESPKEELNRSKDPYYFNRERHSAVQKDFTGIGFDKDSNTWVYPFVMAMVNTKVVRRSNELLDNAYGPNFTYCEKQAAKSFFNAGYTFIFMFLFALLIRFALIRNLVRRWIPQPEQKPTTQERNEGNFSLRIISEVDYQNPGAAPKKAGEIETKTVAPQKVQGLVKGFGDPGYQETAKIISESAICLASLPENEVKGGVLTPASSMGNKLIDRLINAGMVFEVVDEPKV